MHRTANWKTLTIGALMAAMSATGVATAQAAGAVPPPPAAPAPAAKIPAAKIPYAPPAAAPADTAGGAHAEHTQTNGSTAIRTTPRITAEVTTVSPHLLRLPQAD